LTILIHHRYENIIIILLYYNYLLIIIFINITMDYFITNIREKKFNIIEEPCSLFRDILFKNNFNDMFTDDDGDMNIYSKNINVLSVFDCHTNYKCYIKKLRHKIKKIYPTDYNINIFIICHKNTDVNIIKVSKILKKYDYECTFLIYKNWDELLTKLTNHNFSKCFLSESQTNKYNNVFLTLPKSVQSIFTKIKLLKKLTLISNGRNISKPSVFDDFSIMYSILQNESSSTSDLNNINNDPLQTNAVLSISSEMILYIYLLSLI